MTDGVNWGKQDVGSRLQILYYANQFLSALVTMKSEGFSLLN